MSTTYDGFEKEEPEGFMAPTRYKVSFRCGKCGQPFTRTYKSIPSDNPPCPNKKCAEAAELADLRRQVENLTKMLEEGHAPAQIGENVRVKAVDQTADIVMQDYNLPDLRDGIRPGENMVPKLPPAAQKQADSYFSAQAGQSAGMNKKQVDLLRRRAISGAFKNMAVPPTAIAPAARSGDPALVSVGTRQNDLYRGGRR